MVREARDDSKGRPIQPWSSNMTGKKRSHFSSLSSPRPRTWVIKCSIIYVLRYHSNKYFIRNEGGGENSLRGKHEFKMQNVFRQPHHIPFQSN